MGQGQECGSAIRRVQGVTSQPEQSTAARTSGRALNFRLAWHCASSSLPAYPTNQKWVLWAQLRFLTQCGRRITSQLHCMGRGSGPKPAPLQRGAVSAVRWTGRLYLTAD